MTKLKKSTLKQPLLSDLFKKIGKKLGVKVFVEKEWGMVGRISYPNGIHRYFRITTLDLNPVGAFEIARDKDYAKLFMSNMGYPVIPGKKFYSNEWAKTINSDQMIDRAWEYAKQIGLPVFLKPNSKSQGTGVAKVFTKTDFYQTFKSIARIDNVILVEQPILGKDYRIVVLDREIISAYERIPLTIIGDGKRTILQLLERKQAEYKKSGREKTFLITDPRLIKNLHREKLAFDSILPKGQSLQMLFNANLSAGGTSVDVTDKIHPFFKKTAINLTRDMGLRLCGVDLMIIGDITMPAKIWYVIEINASPGLHHYASLGKKQQDIVENLYTKVFKVMGKK
ncbi:hypothetical protein A3J61_02540 [Candidatus Nomurabacteria bacterium RIFCSPHIGHO2_02_FULL_38_15]|uniref:ATP-grasp domain-containing protein n=1 Tax=Candidatus Nomurabacteria bacterium RIFCSPHIGHO2_02_FULL_38_15 TaxID=1801752 RepID=A0A1F6VQJ4_9BACT|nr:MAG: hypothetical protein A3J61_02540 [Candidatus Nomurabacteria bacterium RIFCSPHIGHO2_02_FULL_38_15]